MTEEEGVWDGEGLPVGVTEGEGVWDGLTVGVSVVVGDTVGVGLGVRVGVRLAVAEGKKPIQLTVLILRGLVSQKYSRLS